MGFSEVSKWAGSKDQLWIKAKYLPVTRHGNINGSLEVSVSKKSGRLKGFNNTKEEMQANI